MIKRILLVTLALLAPPLGAQEPVLLDTVRVTAGSRLPGSLVTPFRSVAVIDRATLGRMASVTVADILATTLGVDIGARSAAQADVAMRGSSFEQVLVMVDGVRVSDVQTGHFNLDLAVPLDAIERIEVVRGPASAIYGADAVGGVINIVTRRAGVWDARAWAGSFASFGMAAGGSAPLGPLNARVGADFTKSDGHRPGTDFEILQTRLALEAPLGGGRASLDLGLGDRDFGAADFYGPYPSYESTRAGTGTLRVESRADAAWVVHGAISTRRHSDLFTLFRDDPSIYQNEHVSCQSSAELVARYAPTGPWTLALGTEGRDLQLESARLGNHHEGALAAFAEGTWGNPRGTTLNAGVRLDHSAEWGNVVSPSAAGSLALSHAVALRGSLGKGFRGPTWTERFYQDPANIGNPALQPERFVASELGLRFLPSGLVRADLAAFTRNARDVIDWAKPDSAPTDPWRTMNVAEVRYVGIEAQLDVRELLGVDWNLFATFLDFEADGADGYTGKYALRPVTETAGLSATVPLFGRLRVSLDGVYMKREGEASHVLANTRLAFGLGSLAIQVDVLNLLDADYLDPSTQPAAGRAIYVTGSWRATGRN